MATPTSDFGYKKPEKTPEQEMRKQALAAYRKYLYNHAYNIIQSGDEARIAELLSPEKTAHIAALALEAKAMSKELKSDSVFIVVNTPADTDVAALIKATEKFVTKKWVKGAANWVYSYELHTATGQHPHVNICVLTYDNKKPAEIRRETQSTFKHLIGDNTKNIFYAFRTTKQITGFIDYTKGTKVDKEKKAQVALDDAWREKKTLRKFYAKLETVNEEDMETFSEMSEDYSDTESEVVEDSDQEQY